MTHTGRLCSSLIILTLIPTISFASAVFESGFYIGGKVGAQEAMASWDQDNHLTADITIGTPNTGITLQMNQVEDGQSFHTNIMGNFAVGYAMVIKKLFLAVEGSANIAADQEFSWDNTDNGFTHVELGDFTADVTTTLGSETELELEPDVNLDIRPGLLLAKNFLLYGRVGVAFTRISIEEEVNVTVHSLIDNIPSPPSCLRCVVGAADDDDNVFGLRVGLGVEYKITPTVALAVDYVFTDYGSVDATYEDHYEGLTEKTSKTTVVSSEADVTKNTLTAGLNWYFGGKR